MLVRCIIINCKTNNKLIIFPQIVLIKTIDVKVILNNENVIEKMLRIKIIIY